MWPMRGLTPYLKPYRKFLVLGPLFMIMEVFFDLLQPLLAAKMINSGIAERNFVAIQQIGLTMLVVAVFSLITGVGCNLFASRASQNFGADVREALFTRIQAFSFETLGRFQSGSLITRMTSDVVQVQNLLQMALQGLVRAPSLLIGSVVMALILNVRLGLLLLATLGVLIAVLIILIRFSTPIFARVQARLDAVNTRIQDNLAGIRVVKAFVRGAYETRRFQEVNEDYTRISIRAARFIALNSPIVTLILNGCLVAVLLYGGRMTSEGSMLSGDLVAFVNYVVQVLSSLLMVSGMLMNISQANVSATRIQEVLAAQPETEGAEHSLSRQPLQVQSIRFNQVSFSYHPSADEREWVLRGIDIAAQRGDTVAIIGATGSGKTALVQLLPRLYEVTDGAILFDGHDIRSLPSTAIRSGIGMILQESFLFTGSIRDNIAYGKPDASQEEIEQAAQIAQAHEFISRLPDGYHTMLGQRGVNLSGGQKQRLSIARALLIKPSILVMDDSTSALDAGTERRLRAALQDRMKDSITFLIAQRISTVMDAQIIYVLDEGKIVGRGTHEQLLIHCEVYQDIYRSQFGYEEAPHVRQ